jgi:hypothetical protein
MALDPALLAQMKLAKNKYSRNTSKFVKLKEGKTTIRVVSKPGKFWQENGVHWIKTEEGGKPVAVVGCHSEVHSKPCEVCTAIEMASKSATDDESIQIIKEWQVKKNVLVAALVRSGSEASEDPQIVEMTGTTFGAILNIVEEYAAADIDVFDFAAGVDLIIERTGKTKNDTKYTVMVAPKSKPVPAGTLEKIPNLLEAIEREFFRGEDLKALTAIANMTGIVVRSSGPALTTTPKAGLLTGPAGAVSGAALEEAVVEEIEEVAAPSLADLKAAAAAKAAAVAAAAAKSAAAEAAKVTASPATVPADDFNKALPAGEVDALPVGSADDVDAMLAELDSIKAA